MKSFGASIAGNIIIIIIITQLANWLIFFSAKYKKIASGATSALKRHLDNKHSNKISTDADGVVPASQMSIKRFTTASGDALIPVSNYPYANKCYVNFLFHRSGTMQMI